MHCTYYTEVLLYYYNIIIILCIHYMRGRREFGFISNPSRGAVILSAAEGGGNTRLVLYKIYIYIYIYEVRFLRVLKFVFTRRRRRTWVLTVRLRVHIMLAFTKETRFGRPYANTV